MSAKPYWGVNGREGCALHDRPNATFGCKACLEELPDLRSRIDIAVVFLESAGFKRQAAALRGDK